MRLSYKLEYYQVFSLNFFEGINHFEVSRRYREHYLIVKTLFNLSKVVVNTDQKLLIL